MKILIFLCVYFSAESTLFEEYTLHSEHPTDICEHLPVLKELASGVSSVVEIGVRDVEATWGILQGLSESSKPVRSYLGIDLVFPPVHTYNLVKTLAEKEGIAFHFLQANDMEITLPQIDLLFIDSLHTYCHLTYELEAFSDQVKQYIVLHDTSSPWGERDDETYRGNRSEYPVGIDRNKRGLWPAVVDFLSRHPEWSLQERRINCHGLTILKRNSSKVASSIGSYVIGSA